MPRAIQIITLSLLAATLAVPTTMGAPFVPDVLYGIGAATTFQVFGVGYAIEGAPYEWNDFCARCLIRVTIADGGFQVVDPDVALTPTVLAPGQYELREFKGAFLVSQNAPHDFTVQIQGAGKLISLG